MGLLHCVWKIYTEAQCRPHGLMPLHKSCEGKFCFLIERRGTIVLSRPVVLS